ncbi:hypothetical protein HPB47_005305 [Ixodes persulcatus]|uniref:Uncharacterized protein n=1 Tax=Ixodes persulcatus TaxID=34615 RepID=A0AC60PDL5_IXOPE|nr:hypothetical protein HPB47_005305 [Ixodes persulcatus]
MGAKRAIGSESFSRPYSDAALVCNTRLEQVPVPQGHRHRNVGEVYTRFRKLFMHNVARNTALRPLRTDNVTASSNLPNHPEQMTVTVVKGLLWGMHAMVIERVYTWETWEAGHYAMWVKFENGRFNAEGIAPGPLPESPTRPVSFQYDVDYVGLYISVEIELNYEKAALDVLNITGHSLSAFKITNFHASKWLAERGELFESAVKSAMDIGPFYRHGPFRRALGKMIRDGIRLPDISRANL